jgi:hypothetical protein
MVSQIMTNLSSLSETLHKLSDHRKTAIERGVNFGLVWRAISTVGRFDGYHRSQGHVHGPPQPLRRVTLGRVRPRIRALLRTNISSAHEITVPEAPTIALQFEAAIPNFEIHEHHSTA